MARVRNEIAVGVLFFLGMAILGYFTVMMKDEIFDTRTYRSYVADFPSVNGLQKGERVKMFGVPVGSVTDITIVGRSVRIFFKLSEKVPFYSNYSLEIRSESIMMGKYIDIDPGTVMSENKPNELVDRKTVLIGNEPIDMMAAIETVIKENRSNLRASIANLKDISEDVKEVTDKIARGEGTIGKLVKEDQTQGVKDLVKEARDTLEDSREQAPITSFIRSILTVL